MPSNCNSARRDNTYQMNLTVLVEKVMKFY